MENSRRQYQYKILAALLALALLAPALSGCAAASSGPAQPGQTESGALPRSTDAFIVDALPEGGWLRVWTWNGSVFVQADGRTSGGPYPQSSWLLDETGREAPVRIKTEEGEITRWGMHETLYTLYGVDGVLLLECGRMYPDALLGSLVFLRDMWGSAAPFAYDLATGETLWEGYTFAGQPAEGVYLLSGGSGNPPLLLDEQLRVVRRFEGYDFADRCRLWFDDLPGYIELSRKGSSKTVLYSLALDEVLPGEFVTAVDGERPMGLFSTPAGWLIRDLATGKPLSEPGMGEYQRVYSVYTPQVKIYTLELDLGSMYEEEAPDEGPSGEGSSEEGPPPFLCGTDVISPETIWHYLEYPGGLVRCVEVGPAPGGWYAVRPDGSVLLVGHEGELLCALEARQGVFIYSYSAGPHPHLLLRTHWYGLELLNRDGLLLRSEAGNGSLEQVLPGRYLLYDTENGASLLDASGGEILAGLNWIQPSGVPGIWSVREGRQCGLMNEAGQWLWKLPLKTTLHFSWRPHRGPADAS